jgi:tRNA(Ile)-lysidine synthase
LKNLSFEQRFEKFVSDENLFSADDKILVALSGGVDSVVLMHLLRGLNFKIGVAHCNFQLRAAESDEDEQFVRDLALADDTPFFLKVFNTKELAKEEKSSIQETARKLRYDWFQTILVKASFDLIATAHHLDDSIETIIFNLTNTCGIRGLHGILPNNPEKKLVRPLLFATKNEIVEYANQQGLKYREDSSNQSDKYSRNLIRQRVVPVLKSINPAFEDNFARNIRNFRETEQLLNFAIEKIKAEICEETTENELLKINIQSIFKFPSPETVLFELIYPFGFNNSQAAQILLQSQNKEAAFFESETHIISRNYQKLILQKKSSASLRNAKLIPQDKTEFNVDDYKKLSFEIISIEEFQLAPKNNYQAFFDADQLCFPLSLRYWEEADSFHPFGMSGKKKLSSFFKDVKIPQNKRSEIPLLVSGSKIIWIIGHRTSNDFVVEENTEKILKISLIDIRNK